MEHPSMPSGRRRSRRQSLPLRVEPRTQWRVIHRTTHRSHFWHGSITSLSFVKDDGLRLLMSLAVHCFTVPSRNTVRTLIEKHYNSERAALIQQISSAITDMWTSTSNKSYLTLTLHHLTDDWTLRANVLATRAMPEPHTGKNFVSRLQRNVEEFELKGKVETVVHDIARHKDCAGNLCESWRGLGFFNILYSCPFDQRFQLWARRFPATLNWLDSSILPVWKPSFTKGSRTTARALVQDVAMKWNSTFDMMARVLELHREVTDVM